MSTDRSNHRRLWLLAITALILLTGTLLLVWQGPATEASDTTVTTPTETAHAKARKAGTDKASSVWGADYFPNVPLITHEGETVHFFDDMIEGKVVAINFIYTTCPDACPMETARLKEVQELLGDRVGDDVFFYSITIDPENDTPEVLANYVENWQIEDGWTFLTGEEEDIVLLRQKLGIYIEEIQSEDSNDHNLSLVIGNQATGRWMKRSPYENPYILATQIGSWLHNWKLPSQEKRSYEDAPELRKISTGELLFRTRCESCHSIGEGDVARDARRIGPDLYNVHEQRDPEWLRRWLAEPDVMLEEKDPLAMALFEKYKRVPMPNLRLTDTDIDNVLDYIEEASQRLDGELEAHQTASRAGDHGDHHAGHEGHHMQHGDHNTGHGEHGDHGGHQGEQHTEHAAHGDHPATHR